MPSKKKKIKLKNYSVNAAVHGSKHLGVFRAPSPEAAIEMAEATQGEWCSGNTHTTVWDSWRYDWVVCSCEADRSNRDKRLNNAELITHLKNSALAWCEETDRLRVKVAELRDLLTEITTVEPYGIDLTDPRFLEAMEKENLT